LAVDPVSGTVYVAWADYRNGNADILFIRSTNKAASFSVPVRVNDDSGTNDQFFPWMQSVSGKVALVWYDRRLDPANHNMDVYYAESRDQGVSFQNRTVRISDVSSNPDCCGFGGQSSATISALPNPNDCTSSVDGHSEREPRCLQ